MLLIEEDEAYDDWELELVFLLTCLSCFFSGHKGHKRKMDSRKHKSVHQPAVLSSGC